jgi:hypothetical protein
MIRELELFKEIQQPSWTPSWIYENHDPYIEITAFIGFLDPKTLE